MTDANEPVVGNQVPRSLPLDPGVEVSVKSDKVSIEYRRWLREITVAAAEGTLAAALGMPLARTVTDGLAS